MIKLKDAHVQFLDHLRNKKRASATILAYGKDVEQLISFLEEIGKSVADEIIQEDLEAFMTKLGNEGYIPKYISRKTNSTKTFFRFLQTNSYISVNPANLIVHPKYETQSPRILSKTEYRSLRDVSRNDPRISAIIEILLQTGMRIGELANLHLSDITRFDKSKQAQLTIRSYESHPTRIIPLNKTAENTLDRYLAIRPKAKQDFIFVTKTGHPLLIRNIRSSIDRYFRLAEVKNARVNDLRHTWVAHQLESGASLVLVSKLAGHKRLSTTEKYLAYIQEKVEETTRLEEL